MHFTKPDDSDLQTLGALPPLRSPSTKLAAAPARLDPASPPSLTVLLIDRSPLTRECLSLALSEAANELSVMTADSAEEARALAPVDLILVHAGGEAIEGGTLARDLSALGAALPGVPIVLLAARHAPADVLGALKMGVRGYLSHDVCADELCRALRRIRAGEVFVPAAALQALPDAATGAPAGAAEERMAAAAAHPALTPRQSDVLVRIRQGKSNKVIAFELGMQESTVKVHVRNILKQLGATNRTEAVYLANLG